MGALGIGAVADIDARSPSRFQMPRVVHRITGAGAERAGPPPSHIPTGAGTRMVPCAPVDMWKAGGAGCALGREGGPSAPFSRSSPRPASAAGPPGITPSCALQGGGPASAAGRARLPGGQGPSGRPASRRATRHPHKSPRRARRLVGMSPPPASAAPRSGLDPVSLRGACQSTIATRVTSDAPRDRGSQGAEGGLLEGASL